MAYGDAADTSKAQRDDDKHGSNTSAVDVMCAHARAENASENKMLFFPFLTTKSLLGPARLSSKLEGPG